MAIGGPNGDVFEIVRNMRATLVHGKSAHFRAQPYIVHGNLCTTANVFQSKCPAIPGKTELLAADRWQ